MYNYLKYNKVNMKKAKKKGALVYENDNYFQDFAFGSDIEIYSD